MFTIAILLAISHAENTDKPLPNILFVMADDLGSNDIGYSDPTVFSPNIDKLAAEGVKLNTVYTWDWCAPSRGAMLSGRYAPMSGYTSAGDGPSEKGTISCFPLKYQLVPKLLRDNAGYQTVMVGKWHLGYATYNHTPEHRGFNHYLGYLTGAEDYYNHTKPVLNQCSNTRDLWHGHHENGTVTSGPANDADYFPQYSAFFFTSFLQERIEVHVKQQPTQPLFIYAAYQNVHSPLEVPLRFLELYKDQGAGQGSCSYDKKDARKGYTCDNSNNESGNNCYCNRIIIKAMVSALDEAIGNVTHTMTQQGIMNNTIIVFQGDNGGPTFEGHSNHPLRGGKLNFFEGGVRPASFVYSPLLPNSVKGTWYNGTIHETDWTVTFLTLAGLVGLTSDLDGINAWPVLNNPNYNGTRRTEVLISNEVLRQGQYKLVASAQSNSTWAFQYLKDCMLGTGGGFLAPPNDKNNNTNLCPSDVYTSNNENGKKICCPYSTCMNVVTDKIDLDLCNTPCTLEHPCLWDLEKDPRETTNIASQQPDVVSVMLHRLLELQAKFQTNPPLQGNNDIFCNLVKQRDGFLGPWINVTFN
eukprot:m.64049 g.64049  ORF g.64049 m.64049 type:complete len:582 (+) comp11620_c0_seq2:55-1800(+)